MNENQIKELIKRIVEEVLARIADFGEYKTLALVPEISAYTKEAQEYLSGSKSVAALFAEAEELTGIDCKRIDTADDRKNIIKALKNIEEIVLVTPSLKLLSEIANGDDTQFEAKLFEKAILGGKKAKVLLDFVPPKFKRGTLFEKVVSAVDALRDMGVSVVYLGAKPDEGYALITEFEVNEAAKHGIERLQCAPGAIVTPLAKDTAKEKSIAIDI